MSREKKTIKRRLWLLGALLCLGVWLAIPSVASAKAPKWSLTLSAFPSSFSAGGSGNAAEGPGYRIVAENTGDGPTTAPYTITDTLPADVAPVEAEVSGEATFFVETEPGKFKAEHELLSCEVNGQEVSCTGTGPLAPNLKAEVIIPVNVATGTAGKSVLNEAIVKDGGAAPAKAKLKTAIGLPAWKPVAIAVPTNVPAGTKGEISFHASNVGGAATKGPVTITETLPEGLTLVPPTGDDAKFCTAVGQTQTCTITKPVRPGAVPRMIVIFEASETASGTLLNEVTIEGGGANPAVSVTPIAITPTIAPFGFLSGAEGFGAPLSSAEGTAETQAGSHPYQLTIEMGFPSERTQEPLAAGFARDISVDLPPGEILNPNSTSKLCKEVQLLQGKCPAASQIGTAAVTTPAFIFGETVPTVRSGMFNMVPAPGTPSNFGFDAAAAGIYIHIIGSLRSDGDYGLTGGSTDLLARGPNSVFGAGLTFWGDPSNSSHDYARGACLGSPTEKTCPEEEETKTALVTAPVQCSGQPTITRGHADSWEEPGVFKHASYESADLEGNPVAISGCNQLQYQPSVEVNPTTNLADSPSGLNVDIYQPTNEDPGGVSPAMMRDLSLALPQGMSVNPSSANGLGSCTEAQAHFHSHTPGECPNNSKLGNAEVVTPLLAHPLDGALYLAQPFHNPTNSLIGLYLTIDDPVSGTVTNLAGKAIADPVTGQLTTVFEDNPQLPLEHIRTHLFTGPRAALRTPAACGSYAAKADITPWSAPQTPVAHLTDPFQIQANPNGGACPQQGQPLPNTPSFTAGTLSPQAGEYTPFLFKLTRKDDTAEPVRVNTTLPPGLVAKLAGVPYCPEAGIARASARSKPNEGILERNDPSCPATSKVGTLDVATGAGITPLHTQGNVYLSGPYKGAPLSLAIITPAIAGPFDLGTVVSRVALNIDPETAKVTATSDPLPSILYGIPLDIRSIAFQMDKPDFTLNPTSCDPMSVSGEMATATGTVAPLLVPFQVGGCSSLGFKPKLALRLKGGTTRGAHPALTANLTYPSKGKYANIKTAQVTLPHSEFLDQAHIGTVCTRVQFAADACPAKSIYGKATATTPLLSNPLSGPVYLRSSSHKLPDLLVDLHGQVDVVLAGRIDSVNGGIRTTFEAAPDAPVSKFTLQMQGGKKGLLINSANLCKSPKANKAISLMEAQNGKVFDSEPELANSCKKAKRHKKKSKR